MAHKDGDGRVPVGSLGVRESKGCWACSKRDGEHHNFEGNASIHRYAPPCRPGYIYELILDGECVYIGWTHNLENRIKSHRRKRGEPRLEYGRVQEFCCWFAAKEAEPEAIRINRPLWNKNCKGPGGNAISFNDAKREWMSGGYPSGWSYHQCYYWFGSR